MAPTDRLDGKDRPLTPLRVVTAFGRAPDGPDGWALAVKSCLDGLGQIPSHGLGLIYLNSAFAPHAVSIMTLVRSLTGLLDWVGAASDVVLSVGPAGPVVLADQHASPGPDSGPGIAIMILAFPDDACHLVRLPDYGRMDPAAAAGAGSRFAHAGDFDPLTLDWLRRHDGGGALIHADRRNSQAVAAALSLGRNIGSLGRNTGRQAGGATIGVDASQGRRRGVGSPQICGAVTEGGATGVLFSSAVTGVSGLAQGLIPIGPKRRVTRLKGTESEGAGIGTLDGMASRSAFHDDIGDLLARDPGKTRGFIFAGVSRASAATGPLDPTHPRGDDGAIVIPDDYSVVSILDPGDALDAEDAGSLRLSASVQVGDLVTFVRRDQAGAIHALDDMIDRLVRRVGRDRIRAAHLATCSGRSSLIFGDPMVELRRVADRLGPVPVIGHHVDTPIFRDTLYSRSALLTLWTDFSDES